MTNQWTLHPSPCTMCTACYVDVHTCAYGLMIVYTAHVQTICLLFAILSHAGPTANSCDDTATSGSTIITGSSDPPTEPTVEPSTNYNKTIMIRLHYCRTRHVTCWTSLRQLGLSSAVLWLLTDCLFIDINLSYLFTAGCFPSMTWTCVDTVMQCKWNIVYVRMWMWSENTMVTCPSCSCLVLGVFEYVNDLPIAMAYWYRSLYQEERYKTSQGNPAVHFPLNVPDKIWYTHLKLLLELIIFARPCSKHSSCTTFMVQKWPCQLGKCIWLHQLILDMLHRSRTPSLPANGA